MTTSTVFGMGVFTNALSEFYSLRPLWRSGTHQLRALHRSIVNEVLVVCQATALRKVDWLLDMENKAPFTANEHYLGDYREKFLDSYREAERNDYLLGSPCEMEEVAYETNEVLCTPRDPYEPALHHMASARAYFQGWHRSLSQTSKTLYSPSFQLLSSGLRIWFR